MGRHIVVCCDGTWCGDGTSTTSNIKIIADSFADEELDSGIMKFNRKNNCFVRFFDGVGVAGSFADYLSEGALAANLKDRCVEAYRFIVECVSSCCSHCISHPLGLRCRFCGSTSGDTRSSAA
jgi:uncharacterized protein (DUF2235 family)